MSNLRTDITIAGIHGKMPRIHSSAFIAPGCRIIGDVEIGPDASIWYNCVIRGDVNRIVIGARSNIQDGTVVHCDSPKQGSPGGYPTLIGEDVLIGHMAMIHGCTIEDGAFIGSRCIVVEGVRVGREAVLGAGVTLTASTQIIDVTGPAEVVHKGVVPPRSVVIPGMRTKSFPAGEYAVPCALIIGQRKESTDLKTSLNTALRDFAVAV